MKINFKKFIDKDEGFTLIEIIIYIGIIGVVVSSFVSFSLSISSLRNKIYIIQEVQANSRTVLDLLSQKIRLAEDVITPTKGNSSNILVLDMPNSEVNLTFSVIDNILVITEGLVSPVPIISNKVKVTNLNFTNLAVANERDNVGIKMIIEYNNAGTDIEYDYMQSLQTTVGLRP